MSEAHDYQNASHWYDVLHREFVKESDRAAVILTAALFDTALAQLLRMSLVASPTSTDELFDGASAPLSTFSARINFAYRGGLISRRFCRDLHLIRVIRNQFAHNVTGCTFEDSAVRSRVLELSKSSGMIERNPKTRATLYESGPRGDFLMIASWMLWSLNKKIEESVAFAEASDEFGYSSSSAEGAETSSAPQKLASALKQAAASSAPGAPKTKP